MRQIYKYNMNKHKTEDYKISAVKIINKYNEEYHIKILANKINTSYN